jgi:hypothetical protein
MTEQIKRVITLGKPLSVIKKLIKEELLRLDKDKFDADIKAEYDELFPTHRSETQEEQESRIAEMGELGEETDGLPILVKIDYSEDESYVTFDEYKNETIVVTEAVYESKEIINGSENSTVVTYEDVLVTPEVTELVRPYVPIEVTDEMIQAELDKLHEYKEYLSKQKQDKLNSLYVTVNDKVFDAHLEARLNMATAIQASSLTNQTETQWKMYDNSVQTVTIGELQQALILALTEVGKTIGAIDESTN